MCHAYTDLARCCFPPCRIINLREPLLSNITTTSIFPVATIVSPVFTKMVLDLYIFKKKEVQENERRERELFTSNNDTSTVRSTIEKMCQCVLVGSMHAATVTLASKGIGSSMNDDTMNT